MFKLKEKVVVVEVTYKELALIREGLLAFRASLIAAGRCFDPVDELLIKLFGK